VEPFIIDLGNNYYVGYTDINILQRQPDMRIEDLQLDEANGILKFNKVVLIDNRVVPNRLFKVAEGSFIGEEASIIKIEYTNKLDPDMKKFLIDIPNN
jgi:hypothetical protein